MKEQMETEAQERLKVLIQSHQSELGKHNVLLRQPLRFLKNNI